VRTSANQLVGRFVTRQARDKISGWQSLQTFVACFVQRKLLICCSIMLIG
jgi:hypothetical protein